jgi:hypothetical protein
MNVALKVVSWYRQSNGHDSLFWWRNDGYRLFEKMQGISSSMMVLSMVFPIFSLQFCRQPEKDLDEGSSANFDCKTATGVRKCTPLSLVNFFHYHRVHRLMPRAFGHDHFPPCPTSAKFAIIKGIAIMLHVIFIVVKLLPKKMRDVSRQEQFHQDIQNCFADMVAVSQRF